MTESNNSSDLEKTEQPTPKKQQDAKEKGQVPRSRELNTSVVMLLSSIMLMTMGESIGKALYNIMQHALRMDRSKMFASSDSLMREFSVTLNDTFGLFIPFFLVLLLAVVLTPMLIGGWTFSASAMAPKFSRIDPLKGMKRIFSIHGLVELLKAFLKVLLVGLVAYWVIWNYLSEILTIDQLDYRQATIRAIELSGLLLLILSAATLLIAGIDIPFQLWQHHKQLRMSKQDVRDEQKSTEGNPEIKSRIRRMQQEVANRRMMAEVPTADVIVVNPTHFSVALKYDDKKMGAPVVVAKGVDIVALRIREVAAAHQVSVFEAPPLARALFYNTEIGAEIPSDLYHAVAQVLAYVFQLRAGVSQVVKPDNIVIPDSVRLD